MFMQMNGSRSLSWFSVRAPDVRYDLYRFMICLGVPLLQETGLESIEIN